MNDAELNKLRKLAEAAIPGPWFVSKYTNSDGTIDIEVDSALGVRVASCDKNEAEFIAAADPRTIIQLLDQIDALVTERNMLDHKYKEFDKNISNLIAKFAISLLHSINLSGAQAEAIWNAEN